MSEGLKRVRHRYDDAVSRLDVERLRALLAEYYRRQGYRVDAMETIAASDTEGDPTDAEIGLRLQREDSRLLVRAVHWNDDQVTHQRVRAWQDLLAAEPADGAMFITSGEFTPSAIRTAAMTKTLRLVDGVELRKMLMPLLQPEDAPSIDDEAVFADVPLDDVPNDATDDGRDRTAGRETAAASSFGPPPLRDDAAADKGPLGASADATAAESQKLATARIQRLMWERGSRPASNMSIAVAAALLGMIVLTIVFRDRLDPYLGDVIPTKVSGPREQSPLSGTDYKSDVFDPAIRAQNEPTVQAPKPKRPETTSSSSSQPSADEAIRVIERTTPDIWADEQRRKAAAKEPPKDTPKDPPKDQPQK